MIPLFILTDEEQKELDDKLKHIGEFTFNKSGEFWGIVLRFHEDIHIKRLLQNEFCLTCKNERIVCMCIEKENLNESQEKKSRKNENEEKRDV